MSALVAHPALLLFLLALAIPVALHFLFRRPERRVAWGAMEILRRAAAASAGKTRRREALVLLARLAIVLLLVLGAAAPLVRDGALARALGAEAPPVAIVLDGSLAARARGEGGAGPTRFEAARERAIDFVSALPSGTATSVVLAGSEPRVVLRETRSPGAAIDAMRGLEPGYGRADPDATARCLAEELPAGTRVVRAADLPGDAPASGAGVASLAVEPESLSTSERARVVATIAGDAGSRAARLLVDGVERDRARVEGDRVAFETTLEGAGCHEIAVRLDPGDALSVDDAAATVVVAAAPLAARLDLDAGAPPHLDAALRALAAIGALEIASDADVRVAWSASDGILVAGTAGARSPVESPARRERAARVVPVDPDHPVLRPLLAADPAALERIVVRATLDARPLDGAEVLARFEPGGEPAIVERRAERTVAILVPLGGSDLATGAAHALVPLLAGALARVAPDPPLVVRRHCGERVALEDPSLAIVDADGATLSAEAARHAPPGVYRLVGAGGSDAGRLVLSLDLRPSSPAPPAAPPEVESRAASGFPLLVLFGALLVLESWLAFRASREERR